MDLKRNILYILQNEVKPAVGCTEPVAIALAAAAAASVLASHVDRIDVFLSPNVYKNGMNVGIPSIDEIGLDVAAALGASKRSYSDGLTILGNISPEVLSEAKNLLRNKSVSVKLKDTDKKVYVEVCAYSGSDCGRAVIEDKHDNITGIFYNDTTVYSMEEVCAASTDGCMDEEFFDCKLTDIISEIEQLSYEDVAPMLDGLKMNEEAARLGMEKRLGIGTGYAIHKSMGDGIISKDLPNIAMMMTSAASDARMSGLVIPVMSSNGSGNNGLTAILPIAAYNHMHPQSNDKLARALAISHVITTYIKHYIGRLSPLCGCSIAAATGSACGITWLMGGVYRHIQGTVKNILANLAGVICDGAKPGCSLKLGTAAASGVQSALLAMGGYSACKNNGIVTGTAEQAIKNLGTLSRNGMGNVDKTIIDIMVSANV